MSEYRGESHNNGEFFIDGLIGLDSKVPPYVTVLPDSSFKDIHGRGQVFKIGISNAKFVNPSMHKTVEGCCPEIIFGFSASFSSGKS
jgi:hypothetical protein